MLGVRARTMAARSRCSDGPKTMFGFTSTIARTTPLINRAQSVSPVLPTPITVLYLPKPRLGRGRGSFRHDLVEDIEQG